VDNYQHPIAENGWMQRVFADLYRMAVNNFVRALFPRVCKHGAGEHAGSWRKKKNSGGKEKKI
jgi:hypothetical protein